MPLRNQYWIPGIIFLISFFLHLSLISKGPVTVDCLNLVIKSQATIETHHLHYLYGSGYPLMVLLGSIFIVLGKCLCITDPVIAVNLIGVIFGSITVLALYLLVREICDTLTAILASLMLLLNPLFLDVSTYGINHAPALCFLLLGQLSLLRFQISGKFSNLMLSALFFGFMGATRLQDFILTLPAVSFMFFLCLKTNALQSSKQKFSYFFLFITTIVFIITLFHLSYFIFDHTNYDIQAKNNWKLNLTGGFQGLFSPYFIKSLSYLIKAFNVVGIICFGAGLYYTGVLNKRLLIFTVLWLTIPLVIYSNLITNEPRYFIVLLPALIIPISTLLAHIIRNKKIQRKLIALISFLIITIQPLLNTWETFIRRLHHASIPDYYRWVNKFTEPNATIISSDDGLFITYYSSRKILPKPVGAGHLLPKEMNDFKEKLDKILNNRKSVYMTIWTLISYDRYQEFRNLIMQNYHVIQIGQMPLELWYGTPYMPAPPMCGLLKIETKN